MRTPPSCRLACAPSPTSGSLRLVTVRIPSVALLYTAVHQDALHFLSPFSAPVSHQAIHTTMASCPSTDSLFSSVSDAHVHVRLHLVAFVKLLKALVGCHFKKLLVYLPLEQFILSSERPWRHVIAPAVACSETDGKSSLDEHAS